MPGKKEILIKVLASLVFRLRKKTLSAESVKWIVCSGSVGKTIARRSIVDSLHFGEGEIFTLKTNYCNEFGILLSLLQIDNFSFFSFQSWREIFTVKPKENSCIAIELGADFRLDIDWFLARWMPYLVVLNKATDIVWTPMIRDVLESRLRLCYAAKEAIYVSALDKVHLDLLNKAGVKFLDIKHSKGVYAYPEKLVIELDKTQQFDLKKVNIFLDERFSIERVGNNYLLKDTYKVTPVCFDYFVSQLLDIGEAKTTLIMSEIRPVLVEPKNIYQPFISQLKKISHIYFVGDRTIYKHLAGQLSNIEQIPVERLPGLYVDLEKEVKEGTLSLGIKVSSYYHTK